MGTSAPTQSYDRFRRGRCPQRPGIPPPLCGPPPFHKGGCCCASSGSLVKGSWHGAAVTEGFRTPANPPHPSWASPMPPSPLRGEGYSRSVGSAQMSMAFPSSVTAAPCHLPPGEGFRRAVIAFPLPGEGYIHTEIFKSDSTFCTEKCPVIPLPVPSYTVGYRGSRRIRRVDAWRAKDVDWDGLCAGGWPWD